MSSKLFRCLSGDRPAYGAFTLINQPEVIEILGAVGMDFACMDMMMMPLDWRTAATGALAADRYGMTSIVRLPAFGWTGSGSAVDHHVAAEVLRAVAVGFDAVMVSLETPGQIAAALQAAANPHRRIYLPKFEFEAHGSRDESARFDETHTDDVGRETSMLIPLIESELALQHLDEIFAVEGLEAIFLGMGDISVLLGHANDFTHPALLEFVARTVKRAEKNNVAVLVNIHGRSNVGDVVIAAREFVDAGVKGVFLPFDTGILNRYYTTLMSSL